MAKGGVEWSSCRVNMQTWMCQRNQIVITFWWCYTQIIPNISLGGLLYILLTLQEGCMVKHCLETWVFSMISHFCAHLYIAVSIYIYICICIYTEIYRDIDIYRYIHTYIYMDIFIYINIDIFRHLHYRISYILQFLPGLLNTSPIIIRVLLWFNLRITLVPLTLWKVYLAFCSSKLLSV